MSRLEKSVPKADANLAASVNGTKIDNAPEPLREVLAAKSSGRGPDITEGKPFARNPSSHMGGYVTASGTSVSAGNGAASPAPTLGTLPSFSEGSLLRNGSVDGDEGDGKSAEEVLADVEASEEIFGKAFRGGPKAAAGLMARLQREVRFKRTAWEWVCALLGGRGLSRVQLWGWVATGGGAGVLVLKLLLLLAGGTCTWCRFFPWVTCAPHS